MKPRDLSVFSLVTLALFAAACVAYADTVQKKDGSEIKGVVLDDYKDRIILSTADGELHVMKADIKKVYFDNEERGLLKLAEQARDRGDYVTSYDYYAKALELDPDSKVAQTGIAYLQGYVYKQEEMQKERFVNGHNELESVGATSPVVARNEKYVAPSAVALRKVLGIALKSEDSLIKVQNVDRNSPAFNGGVQRGDVMVAVWGRLVSFMSLDEVTGILLKNHRAKTECTVERVIRVKKADAGMLANVSAMIGASFEIRPDGLTVAEVKPTGVSFYAGLRAGDLVAKIDGRTTRYMPLKKALQSMRSSGREEIVFTIQRVLVLARRPEL